MNQLEVPKYRTPEVLQVTGLKPETLQTWVNRGVISLAVQNPGRGSPRLYSGLDVVKLAVMRRTDDLKLALALGAKWAENAVQKLKNDGEVSWNWHLIYSPGRNGSDSENSANASVQFVQDVVGDPRHMLVSQYTEPFEGTPFSRRDKRSLAEIITAKRAAEKQNRDDLSRTIRPTLKQKQRNSQPPESSEEVDARKKKTKTLNQATDSRPINESKREALARSGTHAEPIVIFPIGETINGTLAQLRQIDEQALGDGRT